MLNDPISNALSKIAKYEQLGRSEVLISPTNKLLKGVLKILNEEGYCGIAEDVTPGRGGLLKLHLLGAINKIGVIKPRFSAKLEDFKKFEKRYLPARALGVIIISTPEGLMTHEQAKEKKIGGRLIAYCY